MDESQFKDSRVVMEQLAEERRARTTQRAREDSDNPRNSNSTKERGDKNKTPDSPKTQSRDTPRVTRNIEANYREIATSEVDEE